GPGRDHSSDGGWDSRQSGRCPYLQWPGHHARVPRGPEVRATRSPHGRDCRPSGSRQDKRCAQGNAPMKQRARPKTHTMPPKVTTSEPPSTRLLRVFAFDPSLSTEMANYEVSEVVTRIPWERERIWEEDGKLETEPGLLPGPTGDYLEVID